MSISCRLLSTEISISLESLSCQCLFIYKRRLPKIVGKALSNAYKSKRYQMPIYEPLLAPRTILVTNFPNKYELPYGRMLIIITIILIKKVSFGTNRKA